MKVVCKKVVGNVCGRWCISEKWWKEVKRRICRRSINIFRNYLGKWKEESVLVISFRICNCVLKSCFCDLHLNGLTDEVCGEANWKARVSTKIFKMKETSPILQKRIHLSEVETCERVIFFKSKSVLKPRFHNKVLDTLSEWYTSFKDLNKLGSVRSDPDDNQAIQYWMVPCSCTEAFWPPCPQQLMPRLTLTMEIYQVVASHAVC